MSKLQRYVSDELTHFVGRGKSEAEQYAILIDVLSSGWLTHPPHERTLDPSVSGRLAVQPREPFSGNEMYRPEVVCFCDIPPEDLHLHMQKFSRFGLSFHKTFLVSAGANPVFYVARDSSVAVFNSDGFGDEAGRILAQHADDPVGRDVAYRELLANRREVTDRARAFDVAVSRYSDLLAESVTAMFMLLADVPKPVSSSSASRLEQANTLYQEYVRRLNDFRQFLDEIVFSFVKFFDHSVSDDDPSNFYLEREWRVVGNVKFALGDVQRVILPQGYSRRLRADVPEYFGQLTFSD